MKILVSLAIGMIVALVAGRWLSAQAARLGKTRVTFLIAVCVISGLIVYPVLHEGGHMIFGMWFGALADWHGVVWTCLGGEEPHGAFTYIPEKAVPFMQAGGHILPTLVALPLLSTWRAVYRKAPWWVSAALVSMPVLFLLSTLGCLFGLYSNTHMDALSVGLGLRGPLRIMVSLSPLLLGSAVLVWIGMKSRRPNPVASGSGNPPPRNTDG
jgi:hypothetical protein